MAADLVVIVNPRNPNGPLSASDVETIFLGKSAMMPNGSAARPVDQPGGSPVSEQFYSKVTGKTGAQVKAIWSRLIFSGKAIPPKELATGADVRKFVASNPDAIGYIEKSAVDASVKVVMAVD